jgi:5-methylcytosine-specific restriction endonuclease McrA
VNRSPLTAYNKAQTACLENGAANRIPCWICGGPINYRRTEATVHYLIPTADDGSALDPNNLVPAHRECVPPRNSRRW